MDGADLRRAPRLRRAGPRPRARGGLVTSRPRVERVVGAGIVALSLVVAVLALAGPADSAGAGDPNDHLRRILDVTQRTGAPALRLARDGGRRGLRGGRARAAGYSVLRHDRSGTVDSVDYSPGHEPSLTAPVRWRPLPHGERLLDRRHDTARGPHVHRAGDRRGAAGGLRVRALRAGQPRVEQRPRRCRDAGSHDPRARRRRRDPGGRPRARRAVALRVRQPIPTVVSLVDAGSALGQDVHLRVMGGEEPATLHNVVAVRPPADPAAGYVVVQGHLDGWFAAAADNGAGAAAVLAAAERLAGEQGRRGLLVALYDGEEWGLLGSEALTTDLARPEGLAIGTCGPVVHLHDVVAVVNLDAPSAIASDVLGHVRDVSGVLVPLVSYRVLVSSEEPTVTALLASTMTSAGVLGLPVTAEIAGPLNGGVGRTDAHWFHEAGIPIAWPVAGYPEYHTEADRTETVDPVDLANVATGTARWCGRSTPRRSARRRRARIARRVRRSPHAPSPRPPRPRRRRRRPSRDAPSPPPVARHRCCALPSRSWPPSACSSCSARRMPSGPPG